ncbi:putative ribonuclease H-like domain-containing protein [Tanacetum coccineum]|uniref:Ribonuclease H-like domain-containing protein n=1 Tax=Tanacetum coccineum TaxID=301880 RepID=A0ABQ5H7U5_9ASTR
MTHPSPKRNIVPKAVLMRSGLVSLTTAKPVNTAQPRIIVNSTRPMTNVFNKSHLTVRRPINNKTITKNSNSNQRINTVRGNNVNTVRPKAVLNAVKGNQIQVSDGLGLQKRLILLPYAQGNPQQDLQEKGVIHSGCSRHMTGNMSYLTDFEEIDGGYVAFGGNPKGGKITGKGTIKTGNLDFENVYFVRELKFNHFSVSQMCDKKNSVLFNDTKCIVLSPNFKLTDESQLLLKVPRKNNMYSVDLKNIIPKGGLTCLIAKATSDESKLWHRRLGHINFKTMNKLVKGNLVRGLPSKCFENNQTCVACQKGKQHKASSTKDKTSGILMSFITRVENLIDQRVKVIRCDNGTEFKNKEMNQFCERKGIKREFIIARTPQQNEVAERKSRTLIEAARTMLANSKLPTTFWAEATACYVQNRVLVTKPHNKTPYELFLGRKLALGFMRPFGCLVTIFNTIDHLAKFDGKANEGFFVGYSINSKAFREVDQIGFFDIDVLTKSMNYKPVIVGNQSNGNASTKAYDDAGKAIMETVPSKDYILLPFDDEKKVDEDPRKDSESIDQEKDDNVNSTNNVNAASTNKVNAIGGKTSIELLDDLNMHALEDYSIFDLLSDDQDDGAEVDMNNLDTTIQISPILTIRIHKDRPFDQVIGDLQSATPTRNMSKNLKEHGTQKGNSCIKGSKLDRGYAGRASTIQVTRSLDFSGMDVKSAFLYGKIEEEVYVCQPPGFEDPDFLDRRGKIDKTFFIRRDKGDILLVQVYVDDIIFDSTKKSLCNAFKKLIHEKFQMSSIGELTFFLGLQVKQTKDVIFISQDKYVAKILKKFGFSKVKTASTPMETQKPLLKDEDGEEVDVHLYRYQVNPKVSHLHAVKRIFRYLKGQPRLGLWYPKDSPFDLIAYTDSDYVEASLDRKSTIGDFKEKNAL